MKGSEDKRNAGGKLPTLPESLFFCSVSSLSATLNCGFHLDSRLSFSALALD